MAATNSSNGSTAASKSNSSGKQSGPSAEQVVAGFQRLRQEQRSLATKAAELEMEINEHSLVIDALREVDPSRKCYRLIGGVLVERTVKEVLPALENNKEQITKIVDSLSTQMQTKGRELNEYRERFNIRIVGEEEAANKSSSSNQEGEAGAAKGGTGVLVS
ncbi:prefoldin subunit 2 [Denticeps clupeoides]|uniref:Prefoldin subunit 2 n=1 Tax=Denticeps clupeoides TaxID=299321 RepID=A0AAY4ALH5_9TELE|nr:prefoldin subunit 2 [Denticeps clupeoides]